MTGHLIRLFGTIRVRRRVMCLVKKYLHYKFYLVGDIWADYLRGHNTHLGNPCGNYNTKDTRVPRAHTMTSLIQKYVREIIISWTRIVERYVMDLLE